MEFVENSNDTAVLRFIDTKQSIGAPFENAVDFIQSEQLLDRPLWAKFVNQYREQPDAPTLAWRGEYWGKMMRGAVSVYSYTKNEELYDVLCETIKDMFTVAVKRARTVALLAYISD